MTTLRQAWARVIAVFRKSALERELDEELASHLELATDGYMRQGMSRPDARRRALIALGGREATKEMHRDSLACSASLVVATLLLAMTAAALIPVSRAINVQPATALRTE